MPSHIEDPAQERDGMKWSWWIGAILIVGLALRVWKAWIGHFDPNYDFGLAGLMAKHMAEGTDFPVFFYGQPYMGSLEPAFSALLCRVFGFSPFVVCLGTALLGTLVLPLVYLWARDAGNRRAGVMALLFCLVGSDTFFHYSVAPRGGYMTMMVCGLASVWLAARIATRMVQGQTVQRRFYLGLGLVAGLGWWSNQLVIVFLAASVVVLLSGFRWRMVREGALPAILMFFVGSAPWWGWNACHGWATFDFGESFGKVPLAHGFQAVARLTLSLVDLSALNSVWNNLRVVLLAGMLALFVVILVRERRHDKRSEGFFFRLAAPVLLILAVLVSSPSKYIMFNDCRYLLPMFPAMAVMLGVGGDWLVRKWRIPVGWAILILLIPKHLYELPRMPQSLVEERPRWEAATRFADVMGRFGDGVCIGDFTFHHWMNLASGEKLCVVSPSKEKYAPYARRAELASRPAVLEDCWGIDAFLKTTGGKGEKTSMAGISVDYNLEPPPDDWRYVEACSLAATEDDTGKSYDRALVDGILDTRWSVLVETTNFPALTFTFDRPVPLCGIRLLSPNGQYPARLQLERQQGDNGRWETIVPMTEIAGYFWSGRRVMLGGVQFFEELRFDVPTGGVRRVRLTCGVGSVPSRICLGDILFLESASPPEVDIPSVQAAVAALKTNGVKRFYGPRWLAGHVALAMKDQLTVAVPSSVFRSVNELPERDPLCPWPVVLKEKTGFLMDVRVADRSRDVLRAAGRQWQETTLGRYVLLAVSPPAETEDVARYPTFYWTEQGCFAADKTRFLGRKAHVVYEKAIQCRSMGDREEEMNLLRTALDIYPAHEPARRALIDVLKVWGRHEEAARNMAILAAQTVPQVPAPVRFPYGIEFLGLESSASTVAPGGSLELEYVWRCPPSAESKRPRVFVHFLQGKRIGFQDDHDLLAEALPADIKEQPFLEIFRERRCVVVPDFVSPGEYEIRLGLYCNESNERLKPRTRLPVKHRAVLLPFRLKVNP